MALKRLNVKLTPEEHKSISDRAKQLGLTMTDYIKLLVKTDTEKC